MLLSLIPAVGGKYLESRLRMEPDDCMRSSREIRKALQPYYFGAREEMVYLMGLDAKLKLLGIRKVSEGTANTTQITARKVMEHALSLGASAVVLAHNHPSGLGSAVGGGQDGHRPAEKAAGRCGYRAAGPCDLCG